MVGAFAAPGYGDKIKGGKWTVIRFFCVSVAFTIGMMTVSSELAYYKRLYGPAILLQMNIAYFLPSLPLMVISSLLDERLDRAFGISQTILARLLFGLGGSAAFTAAWPFLPDSRRVLLIMVALLGVVSGVAFSAAYQLVAKFANKNIISLGLGCVGSGVVVLILETALQIKSSPTHWQEVVLFELTAVVILLGAASAFSLLIRHWQSIEGTKLHIEPKLESAFQMDSEIPLLETNQSQEVEAVQTQRAFSRSLSRMIKYTPLDPFDTISDPEGTDENDDEGVLLAIKSLFRQSNGYKGAESWSAHSPRAVNLPAFSDEHSPSRLPMSPDAGRSELQTGPSVFQEHQPIGLIRVIALTWPIMTALFLAGNILCILFPFFTFLPSSGWLGETLPQVLFFVRLFGDITGRTIPRKKALALRSQRWILVIAVGITCTLPFFFVYIKGSWHSDILSIVYITLVWTLLGYVNSCSYMLAPQKVPTHAKSMASGALAIMYQGSHMLGLLIALILALSLFGSFEV